MTIDEWQNRGDTFRFYDQNIFYISEGEGPVVLLLHGFPTSSWDWIRIFDGLKSKRRLIALDFIGFGFSAKPVDFEYTIGMQADLVEELLAELNIHEVDVLAHDFGDTVAQELLARQINRRLGNGIGYPKYNSCVFLNGGLFPETHKPRLIQKVMISSIGGIVTPLLNKGSLRKNFHQIFGPKTPPSDEEIDQFWSLIQYNDGAKIFHKLIRYMAERKEQRERWVSAIQNAQIPIRLINGGFDPISGSHMAQRFNELIPDADIVNLPDIGHYPQIESPDLVLKHYNDFLSKVEIQ